jgi:hypothetical protein
MSIGQFAHFGRVEGGVASRSVNNQDPLTSKELINDNDAALPLQEVEALRD